MKVKIEVCTEGVVNSYEAESVLFTQTVEYFHIVDGVKSYTEPHQVPALIVMLDDGEYKAQPLKIDNGTVKVRAIKENPIEYNVKLGE